MTDITCLSCGSSIATISGGNVYACGHLLCGTCGSDSKCRNDGSYTIIEEDAVIQSIQTIQETYEKLKNEGESADWSPYYAELGKFRELIAGKCPQRCGNGHSYGGEMCKTCGEASEQKQPDPPQPTQAYCPVCNTPMSDVCPTCSSREIAESAPKEEKKCCSYCGLESQIEVCEACQQRAFISAQSHEEVAVKEERKCCSYCGQESQIEVCEACQQRAYIPAPNPEIPSPSPIPQSKFWICKNCAYKYCTQELNACPNCHNPRT